MVSGADVVAKKDINTLSVEELSSVLDKMDEAVSFYVDEIYHIGILEHLTPNAVVASVLGLIPASSDTVKSEGRQMKQCCRT